MPKVTPVNYTNLEQGGFVEADFNTKGPIGSENGGTTRMQNHPVAVYWRKFSYWWSSVLLIFAITVVVYGICQQWNNPPWDPIHPVFDLVIFLLLMAWISLLEGCQISIVGLANINVDKYKESHPRAWAVCNLAHRGPNVERFLVGRQFLLLFNGFLVNRIGGGANPDFYIGDWEWDNSSTVVFYLNNVLLMIVIVVPGQLITQLLAADKMLGFLNLPFYGYYTVLMPCLAVESIGLTHSSYLLKDVLCKIAGIDQAAADPEKAMTKNAFYYARVVLSCSAVIFSGTFIIKGLAMSQTGATAGPGWDQLPGFAAVIVALFFIFLMACAEGLQVSALALMNEHTNEYKHSSPLAFKTTKLLYAGRNMNAFLVGRQFITALMMMLLGRVTSYAGSDLGDGVLVNLDNSTLPGDDWGMGQGFNSGLLQTGFLGAIFVVNIAQLASQVTASIFPVKFINNYFLYFFLQLLLLIETSGIVNSCWPLASAVDKLIGMPKDPFEGDVEQTTMNQQMIDRKKSLGIPVAKGVTPFDLTQGSDATDSPAIEYTYKVSYI